MKNILLTVVAICIAFTVFPQSSNWSWAKSIGGISTDRNGDIVADANGNVYVTGNYSGLVGWSISVGGFVLNCAGGGDIFIAKYDSSGNVLWANSIGGTGSEAASGITIDVSGNILLTGTFTGPSLTIGSFVLNNSGGTSDVFIAKFDPVGNVIWATSSVGSGVSGAVSADANGNVLLIGRFGTFGSSAISFGSVTVANGSGHDIVFVVKFDSSGNAIWGARSNGNGWDYGTGIAADAAGNVYVTGYFGGTTTTFSGITLTSAGNNDMFLVKYDSSGTIIWARNAGGLNEDFGQSLSADPIGNVYVAGNFFSGTMAFSGIAATNPDSAVGAADYFVVKYDSAGHGVWAANGGGSSSAGGTDVSIDGTGNTYITGYYSGTSLAIGSTILTNNGNTDVFIAKYDASGNVVGARNLGGAGYEFYSHLSANANGNVFATGDFISPSVIAGNDTLTNAGDYDVFIAKAGQVNSGVGINEISLLNNGSSIFPNPASGQFTITSEAKIEELKISNLIGQMVFESKPGSKSIQVHLNNPGIYFVQMLSGGREVAGKILIEE